VTVFLFRPHLLVLVISSAFCPYVPSFSLPHHSTHPPSFPCASFPFPVSLLQIRLTFLSFIFLFSTSFFYLFQVYIFRLLFLICLLLLLLCLLSKVPEYYSVSNCQFISSRYSGTTYMYNITQIICRFFMNSLYVFHA